MTARQTEKKGTAMPALCDGGVSRHLYDQLLSEPAQKESKRTEFVRRKTEFLKLIQQLCVTFSGTAAPDDTQHPSMTNNTREPFISH